MESANSWSTYPWAKSKVNTRIYPTGFYWDEQACLVFTNIKISFFLYFIAQCRFRAWKLVKNWMMINIDLCLHTSATALRKALKLRYITRLLQKLVEKVLFTKWWFSNAKICGSFIKTDWVPQNDYSKRMSAWTFHFYLIIPTHVSVVHIWPVDCFQVGMIFEMSSSMAGRVSYNVGACRMMPEVPTGGGKGQSLYLYLFCNLYLYLFCV